MEIREVTYAAVVIRITVAFFLGGFIGLERGLKNRPAGLRTYMLVCVGSCLIMLTNQYIYQVFGTGDPVRMGAQVVSGIGFLGAGTIVVTKHNQIKGLTTAAGLWAAAAIGLALGIGFYEAAIIGSTTVFIVLTLLHSWDDRMHHHAKVKQIYFELSSTVSLGEFMRHVRQLGIEIDSVQLERDSMNDNGVRSFIATLKLRNAKKSDDIFSDIQTIHGLTYAEEL